jgi:hypothetical protein
VSLLAISDCAAVAYYCFAMGWSGVESARFVLGALVLWGPLGLLLSLALRAEVPDPIVRLTMAATASYALTTLTYFAFAVLHVESGFYVLQAAVTGGLLVYAVRRAQRWRTTRTPLPSWRQLDWILIGLLAASVLVNVRYKTPFETSPTTGAVTFLLYPDHLYHVGQVAELSRHVPPTQQMIRAGTPERAYHMFPHLTTMLLARFTGQEDLLRVHLGYHYTVIEIGLCLVLFSIVRALTQSSTAGYIAAGLLYLGAISLPPLVESSFPYFYFTILPDASSGVDPVRMMSPQMYSGLLVMYGALLGVLLLSIRLYGRQRAAVLSLVVALMVAALSRFRIQVFLPMLPGFVLLTTLAWWRRGERTYLAAAAIAMLVGALLCLEMRSALYLPGTTGLRLGYNGVSLYSWINSWPLASWVHQRLAARIGDAETLRWMWQIVSLSNFVLLNMIGVPLLVATIAYLLWKPARRDYLWFTVLTVWMVVCSTVGAMVITTDYDSYSVGGQLPLHTRWYVFPFLSTAVWWLWGRAQRRLGLPRVVWIGIAVVTGAILVTVQQRTPLGGVRWAKAANKMHFDADEWQALRFLRDQTARDAVILSDKYVDEAAFVFSGLTGRPAYLEAADNPVDRQVVRLNPADNRRQIIRWLWWTAIADAFCNQLSKTGATHVVEYGSHMLNVRNAPCLHQVWMSPARRVRIWEVRR